MCIKTLFSIRFIYSLDMSEEGLLFLHIDTQEINSQLQRKQYQINFMQHTNILGKDDVV